MQYCGPGPSSVLFAALVLVGVEENRRGRKQSNFPDHVIRALRELLWQSMISEPLTYEDTEALSPIVGAIDRFLRESGKGMQVGIDPSLAYSPQER